MILKKILCLLAALILLAGCFPAALAEAPVSAVYEIREFEEFGGVYLISSFEGFLQTGFHLGDSCDLEFSNGFRMEDLPVYDGYYCRSGSPLIVLYPGYDHPCANSCNIGNLWTSSGAKAGDTVTVTLREKGKYADEQEALSAVYTNHREDYASDEVFSNFRELSGGRLRSGFFFRGASPVDDKNLRAACTDALIRQNGIGFVLDLADTEEKAAAYPFFSGSRLEELLGEGRAACVGLNAAYRSAEYAEKLCGGLRRMISQDQPVYIHCTEGKDRTGFVCLLLEALAGADEEELLQDYMITYENYYGITEAGTPGKYASIVQLRFRDMIEWLAGVPEGTELAGQTFEQPAREYLAKAGMTESEIGALTQYLIQDHD